MFKLNLSKVPLSCSDNKIESHLKKRRRQLKYRLFVFHKAVVNTMGQFVCPELLASKVSAG